MLIAVNRNEAQAVKFLLSMRADPNIPDQNTGWTPLLSAANEGSEEIARMLLAAGADRKAERRGNNAERQAAAKGHAALAKLIREYRLEK